MAEARSMSLWDKPASCEMESAMTKVLFVSCRRFCENCSCRREISRFSSLNFALSSAERHAPLRSKRLYMLSKSLRSSFPSVVVSVSSYTFFTLAKRLSFMNIASLWDERRGERSFSSWRYSSVELLLARGSKVSRARLSSSPLLSRAAMVLRKVGDCGLEMMERMFCFCFSMPRRMASL